ncbi:GNAT family N-acetyltransferase [Marinimicrobium sp. C6131]|uniref:GNAT family N-acetyltransferase n=1 Tax=Marinimicrobium sp. C6131 TaxID=3022676 RepID=UPI00223E4CAA|nr:GNAT family N-acetyltransferase [Marinimicrobium sp. C6131]UZJ43704.1 GNAT family N-acetyltransferase [Marinimicrobium sp. C6131]
MTPEFIDRIHAVSPEDWDRLCPSDFPFTRHAFLAALEDSGSVGEGTGWQPQHLLLRDDQGELKAAMPVYRKDHSYGEYVFDWGWAQAYAEHGLDYYPKLISAIPFTPCAGPRLLAAGQEARYWPAAIAALQQQTRALGASGWHCLFPDEAQAGALRPAGLAERTGCQFHWMNRHYQDFEDFLGQLSSRKRKNLRKERRQVAEQGFRFHWKIGADIGAEDWALFFGLYQLTYLKRSGHGGYLTAAFFRQLGEQLPEQTLMVQARLGDDTIAAALFLFDRTTLYGRYWGCRAEFEFLHFETCYYQGLDFVLARGLERFDGGAQGEHKLARGFEPRLTSSFHQLIEPAFQEAVQHFVAREREEVLGYRDAARSHLPYRQPDRQ